MDSTIPPVSEPFSISAAQVTRAPVASVSWSSSTGPHLVSSHFGRAPYLSGLQPPTMSLESRSYPLPNIPGYTSFQNFGERTSNLPFTHQSATHSGQASMAHIDGSGEFQVKSEAGKTKRTRTTFTSAQLHKLRQKFEVTHNPSKPERAELAGTLGLEERKVTVWFQNQRARVRKAQGAGNAVNQMAQQAGIENGGRQSQHLGGRNVSAFQPYASASVSAASVIATQSKPPLMPDNPSLPFAMSRQEAPLGIQEVSSTSSSYLRQSSTPNDNVWEWLNKYSQGLLAGERKNNNP